LICEARSFTKSMSARSTSQSLKYVSRTINASYGLGANAREVKSWPHGSSVGRPFQVTVGLRHQAMVATERLRRISVEARWVPADNGHLPLLEKTIRATGSRSSTSSALRDDCRAGLEAGNSQELEGRRRPVSRPTAASPRRACDSVLIP
jgi:hypothetical protein